MARSCETKPERRWSLANGIMWDVEGDAFLPHEDHLEMSGRRVSVIVRYGVAADGSPAISRRVVWPGLRTVPNDTHGSLAHDYSSSVMPRILVEGAPLADRVRRISFDGLLHVESAADPGLRISRTLFPSTRHPAALERWTLRNVSGTPLEIAVDPLDYQYRTDPAGGVDGAYLIRASGDYHGRSVLMPGEQLAFAVFFDARMDAESALRLDAIGEEQARRSFVAGLRSALRLETPEPVLNLAFDFAKLRAAESVFETRGGLMHSPGGGPYYAAIWCNDEAEYAGPFFPFLGDAAADEASLNCYRLFARHMGADYAPIPSSIVAEGVDVWAGVGDRGDAAMYAYGAARFALALGHREVAEELWEPILWALEYCRRKTTAAGVIASDSDELENRFPSGDANLSTASLAYGTLRSAADLGRSLGKPEAVIRDLDFRADRLAAAIEANFGAEIEGFQTYRYYEGNTVLRSWICLPLTMGILDRKAGTIDALFSPALWTADGLATQSGDRTFWDRSTLYGFRGVLAAGETERALTLLTDYTVRRLLGEHVPYAVEAYPEGNQRHLSAESALYCRVFIEGLFGVQPKGLDRFSCLPRLPRHWDRMALRSVHAFGRTFDLIVERAAEDLRISVVADGAAVFSEEAPHGRPVVVTLPRISMGQALPPSPHENPSYNATWLGHSA